MTQENKHTPLPWRIEGEDEPTAGVPAIEIMAGEMFTNTRKSVAYVNRTVVGEKFKITKTDKANAEFITCSCNSHYELVKALETILEAAINGESNPQYYAQEARYGLRATEKEAN